MRKTNANLTIGSCIIKLAFVLGSFSSIFLIQSSTEFRVRKIEENESWFLLIC